MSILPLLLKVCERVINEQGLNYFQTFFNEIFCGFRKAYNSTQHDLFKLLLYRGMFFGSNGFFKSLGLSKRRSFVS